MIRLAIGPTPLLARTDDRYEPAGEAVAEGVGHLAGLCQQTVELCPARATRCRAVSRKDTRGPAACDAVRLLRSRWRRQLHLPEPVVGRLGETPRPLDELTGLSVKADAVDDDRRRVGEPVSAEVADDGVEPVELRLVVLVDRARESAEGAVAVDRADESTLGRQIAVRKIERHR